MKNDKIIFLGVYSITTIICIVFMFLLINSYKTESELVDNDEEVMIMKYDELEEAKRGEMNYLSLMEDPNADDAKAIEQILIKWNFQSVNGKKIAYLTFDDGPSTKVTGEVLDVLEECDVKATFFVLGSMVEKSDEGKLALIRMVQEGHAIGNHGYCHKYDVLYPNSYVNVTAFMNDMDKSLASMKEVLGENFYTRVIRFPGGHNSWKTKEIDNVLEEKNYAFVDWNVVNGDGHYRTLSTGEMINNLKTKVKKLEKNNDTIIILMHDTEKNINEATYLKEAIIYLKELGYEFRTLK